MLKRLTAACVILGVVAISPQIHAEILEQVLVKVNGEIITKTEFEARQVAELRNRPELANASQGAELQKAVAEITPDLILSAVDELLMVQRGRESGYALGDQQFAQILENIKTSNNLQDETKFQEALKQEGLTMADLRRNLERQMLVRQVQRVEILDKISVTDEEARAFYDAHKQEFTSPSEITLRESLIEVKNSDRGVNVAEDERYFLAFGCVTGSDAGAMGLRYVNMDLVGDPDLDPTRPEIVIYEALPNGRLRLIGADFLVLKDAWDANHPEGPPQLMGQLFHLFEAPNRFGLPAFYTLHVWAWKDNPNGTFVNWHPKVSCDSFEAQ